VAIGQHERAQGEVARVEPRGDLVPCLRERLARRSDRCRVRQAREGLDAQQLVDRWQLT
jgi:hypothetical protein